MSPKHGARGGGCSSQPARPPFLGFGPRPRFGGVDGPFPHPPFMVNGSATFPCGRGGRGGFPLRGGFRGAGHCRPPFRRRGAGPCFERRGWRPFRNPVMAGRAFHGAWWGAPHRWHCGSRRSRHSVGTDALTTATFELARALWTLSREDDCPDEEEQETSLRGGQENGSEARAGAGGESSSGTKQNERDGQCEPTCCRSEEVWEDCGQGSWMTEVEVWPYAEDEVETYMLEDGRVEVRCEHAHGDTPVSSNIQVLPCPPCGPATLTTAHGPPNAELGMMVILVTAKEPQKVKESTPVEGERSAPVEEGEHPAEEDAEIVDISEAMEKC